MALKHQNLPPLMTSLSENLTSHHQTSSVSPTVFFFSLNSNHISDRHRDVIFARSLSVFNCVNRGVMAPTGRSFPLELNKRFSRR